MPFSLSEYLEIGACKELTLVGGTQASYSLRGAQDQALSAAVYLLREVLIAAVALFKKFSVRVYPYDLAFETAYPKETSFLN